MSLGSVVREFDEACEICFLNILLTQMGEAFGVWFQTSCSHADALGSEGITAVWACWGVEVCACVSDWEKEKKKLFSSALSLLITQKGCHSEQIAVLVWLMVAVMLLISFIQKIIPVKKKKTVDLKCLSFCFQLQRSMTHHKVIPCSPDGVCWSGI